MPTFLITGATGQQGSGAVESLLTKGATVHALTRSANSPASQALAAQGAKVFEGSFSDHSVLAAAMKGCDGVFLNVLPTSTSGELNDAENVLAVARAAGISHVMYTSVTGATWADHLQGAERAKVLPEGGFQTGYWARKSAIEQKVRTAGFRYWTILRPGMFMSAVLNGVGGAFFPKPVEGKDQAEMRLAASPKTVMSIIHPSDIGKVAAEAFTNPQHWHEKIVDLAVEDRTLGSIMEAVGKAGGKEVVVTGYSDEELQKIGISNPLVETMVVWGNLNNTADLDQLRREGIQLRTLEQFLEERKEDVRKTLYAA